MAEVTPKELERAIKSAETTKAYYLYGADLYSVQRFKKALVGKIVREGSEDFNLHEFQGKGISIDDMSAACEGIPIFAEKMCVTVCDLDLDSERLSSDMTKLLLDTVKNLPDTTTLIFYTANIDVCGGRKAPTAKNKKLIDAVNKIGTVCRFITKTKSEAARDIAALASTQGCTIDAAAAQLLYDRCIGDFMLISGETDKLCSYVKNGNITVKEVELLTPETPDAKGYELADAVAKGNVTLAMKLLNELTAMKNDPVYLLYIITGSIVDLYRARLALDFNRTVGDVVSDFGYAKNLEFRVKNAFSAVRNMSAARLRKCLEILVDTDFRFKTGAGIPSVLLEEAIIRMAQE